MPALAYVRTSATQNTSGAQLSVASPATVLTAGNHVFVYLRYNAADPTITLTDTAGNAYTAITKPVSANNQKGQWFYKLAAAGHAANVVTATFASGVSYPSIRVIELSGTTPTGVTQYQGAGVATANLTATLDEPGVSVGAGGALLFAQSNDGDNTTAYTQTLREPVTITALGTPNNYLQAAYALAPSGVLRKNVTLTSNNNYLRLFSALAVDIGGAVPSVDTLEVTVQAAAEVLRLPDPAMRSAQVAVEVVQLPGGSNMRSAQLAIEVVRANGAPVVNDRDLLLQATTPRYSPSTTAALILSATAPLFHVSGGGGASPSSITVTAQLVGLSGTVAFAATGGSTISVLGNTATLVYTDMVGANETITASITSSEGVLYLGSYLIGSVTDGAAGTAGARSPGQFAFSGYSSWSDAAAVSELATAGYGAPINRDIVTLYDASNSTTKFYDSGSWLTMSAYIDGNLLVSGTISCAKLAADTMTGQTYRTSAGFPRIEVSGAAHTMTFYDVSGAAEVIIGGNDASVYVDSSSGFSPSVYGTNDNLGTSFLPAVAGSGAGGVGVYGSSTNGYGGSFYSTNDTALSAEGGATGANPSAFLDGSIVMFQRAPGVADSSMNTLLPAVTDYYNCGSSTYVWSQCHASNFYGVYNTPSDARLKADVAPLAPGLSFILALRPVSYTVKEAGRVVTLPPQEPDPEEGVPPWKRTKPKSRAPAPVVTVRPGVRTHFGLIAQEVRSALEAAGCADAGAWGMADKADPASMQHLNYTELIAPLVKAVQELAARVAALEKK